MENEGDLVGDFKEKKMKKRKKKRKQEYLDCFFGRIYIKKREKKTKKKKKKTILSLKHHNSLKNASISSRSKGNKARKLSNSL